ncbi:MAG: radical SAM protein [Lachnospiraceae bacterium]|nr:radical SAM protein [Lachnospiraceae bacterium]
MKCFDCPRKCGVERDKRIGYCKAPAKVKIARAALHFWEEPCISGEAGSGTVFFSGCNLGCVYCQNKEIANGTIGKEITIPRLAKIFLELQDKGANNINLVTPSHYYRQIKEALIMVKDRLTIPVISNTSSYESLESLKSMEGLIDIYLADYKYDFEEPARRYSNAPDYPEVARAALNEMYRQVGGPVFDEKGLMKKGMIIRYLLLPGQVPEGKAALRYLHKTFKNNVFISIMNQYTPMKGADAYPEINRKVTEKEYQSLVDFAVEKGIKNGFTQEGETAKESFIPLFDLEGVEGPELIYE